MLPACGIQKTVKNTKMPFIKSYIDRSAKLKLGTSIKLEFQSQKQNYQETFLFFSISVILLRLAKSYSS
jgi:hypothetical protein